MKQKQFLFVEILYALFLLIIFFGNFLGLLFISNGNTFISLVASLVLVVCYYFLINFLTDKKELMFNGKFPNFSHFFWIPFLFLGLITFFLTSHFINIEYNAKIQIQQEVNAKLALVKSLPGMYEKRAKIDLLNYQVQIQNKTNQQIASAKLAPVKLNVDKNLQLMTKNIEGENEKFNNVFENWRWFSLMDSYNKIDAYVDSNVVFVNAKLSQLPLDKSELGSLGFEKSQLPLSSPLELNKKFQPNLALPLGIVLLSHLFILIPFFSKKIPKRVKGEEPDGAVIL